MKIVCDSCSAKYSIADEKVAGRVFKIRCKKCGAAIVVRGDQIDAGGASETAEASTRVVDYGGDAVWHIVVDGEQQGPYAPVQLGEMLSAGTIGWDAFVWREGFDDWKPAQDIEDLVQAIMGGSQGADASGAAEPAAAEPAAADPFAAAQPPAEQDAGVFGAPAAVAARNNDAGADLFAQTDTASPFGASSDEEDDVVASAPSPRVSADQALTGARNENSVLFSLSNLQALATGPGGGSSPSSASSSTSASPKPGMAQGEGSGLIDIRALASATGVAPGSSGPITSASTDNKVDDLLSIGGTGAGGLGSSLGAPVLIPERKQESNKPMLIAIGAAAIALLAVAGLGVMVLTSGDSGDTPVAAAGTVAPGQTVTAAETSPTPTPPADPPPAAEPAAQAGAAIPEPAEAADEEEDEEADADDDGAPAATKARRRGRRPTGGASGGGSSAPERATPAAPSRNRRSGGGGGDIDDLLNSAIGGGGGGGGGGSARSGGGGASSGPQTPSRNAVVSAMNGVQGAVRACANGASGMATVRVSFSGSNGRATSANVTGSLPGPVKSCISRAVRQASVPPFQQSSFSVTYPFRL